MKRCLLAMLFLVLMLVATAAPAFAQGSRPVIGAEPPGTGQRNANAEFNPGQDDRTTPRTGGIRFNECENQPAPFCQQP